MSDQTSQTEAPDTADTSGRATGATPDTGLSDHIRRVPANGIEIAYETFGDPGDPAMLLVMGLGTQMLAWRDEMCEALAAAGHYVIRYDNRDCGLSTHIDAPVPKLTDMVLKRGAPYSVADMADDAFGLLDALGIDRFHLVGVSMGGMIAQTIALARPERVITLTLIMTSTGSRKVGRPTPAAMRRLATQDEPTDRESVIEASIATYKLIGSPDHLDLDHVRELAGRSYDRAHNPAGRMRQLAAILSQPDRTAALRTLKMPTLVIHGLHDQLVTPSGGLALAKAIPGATFIGHAGMGHDLPHTIWQIVTEDILRLVERTRSTSQDSR